MAEDERYRMVLVAGGDGEVVLEFWPYSRPSGSLSARVEMSLSWLPPCAMQVSTNFFCKSAEGFLQEVKEMQRTGKGTACFSVEDGAEISLRIVPERRGKVAVDCTLRVVETAYPDGGPSTGLDLELPDIAEMEQAYLTEVTRALGDLVRASGAWPPWTAAQSRGPQEG